MGLPVNVVCFIFQRRNALTRSHLQLLMYCCKWSLKARFVVDTAYR